MPTFLLIDATWSIDQNWCVRAAKLLPPGGDKKHAVHLLSLFDKDTQAAADPGWGDISGGALAGTAPADAGLFSDDDNDEETQESQVKGNGKGSAGSAGGGGAERKPTSASAAGALDVKKPATPAPKAAPKSEALKALQALKTR